MAAAWLSTPHSVPDGAARRFAFFLCAIGLGMGYVIQALGQPVIFGNPTDTLDWRMPELTAFYSVLALPHFAWSGVFAAVWVAVTLKAAHRGRPRLSADAGRTRLGSAPVHTPHPVLS